jgi:HYR domain
LRLWLAAVVVGVGALVVTPGASAKIILSLPGDLDAEAASAEGAVVTYVASAANPGGHPVPVVCEPRSGAMFPIGRTTVTCVAGEGGNAVSGSFAVTVRDTKPPSFGVAPGVKLAVEATGSSGVRADHPAVVAFLAQVAASVNDLVDPRPAVTHDGPADFFPPGTTTVTFTAVDKAGNVGRTQSQVAVGEAAAPPDLRPPGNVRLLHARAFSQLVVLRWRHPTARDFHHVVVFRSRVRAGARLRRVYRGAGFVYRDRRVRNGVAYRYFVFAFDEVGNRSRGRTITAVPRKQWLQRPRNGAAIALPLRRGRLVFRWRAVRRATYYNFQLYRGRCCDRKLLSTWPRRPRLMLPRTWRHGGARRLTPGRYTWYVWPGFGRQEDSRYGRLLGTRQFTVYRPA